MHSPLFLKKKKKETQRENFCGKHIGDIVEEQFLFT